jgi:Cell Wall Hydrolase
MSFRFLAAAFIAAAFSYQQTAMAQTSLTRSLRPKARPISLNNPACPGVVSPQQTLDCSALGKSVKNKTYGGRAIPTDLYDRDYRRDQFQCLACNLYFEARSQGTLGMSLVAEITLNRVRPEAGSENICRVVFSDRAFSWTNGTAKIDASVRNSDREAWNEAQSLADRYGGQSFDPQSGLYSVINPDLYCYRYYLSLDTFRKKEDLPSWALTFYNSPRERQNAFIPVCSGDHIFMRDPADTCGDGAFHDPEADDVMDLARRDFFKFCMGAATEPDTIRPAATAENRLCPGVDLDTARRANWEAFPDVTKPPGINDLPEAKATN